MLLCLGAWCANTLHLCHYEEQKKQSEKQKSRMFLLFGTFFVRFERSMSNTLNLFAASLNVICYVMKTNLKSLFRKQKTDSSVGVQTWNIAYSQEEHIAAELEHNTLVIRGTGKMKDYRFPWDNDKEAITAVVIPAGITHIGVSAFCQCCNLTQLTIPHSVTSIGMGAFRECTALTEIIIPDNTTHIGAGVFEDCSSLTKVILPDNTIYIAAYAFDGCSNLTEITLPHSLADICEGTFRNCRSLTGITIPQGVARIGIAAFRLCSALTEITIPARVITIGDLAFCNCPALVSVTNQSLVPQDIHDDTFSPETYQNAILYVPNAALAAYRAAPGWRNFKTVKPFDASYSGDRLDFNYILTPSCGDAMHSVSTIQNNI